MLTKVEGMNRTRRIVLGSVAIGALVLIVGTLYMRYGPGTARHRAARSAPALPAGPQSDLVTQSIAIQRGDTMDDLLARGGIDEPVKAEIISTLKGVFDFRRLRAGAELLVTHREGKVLEWVEYLIDPDHQLQVSRAPEGFRAAIIGVPSDTRVVPVYGKMQGSLFESVEDIGERPELALKIAEIFAWDLDFYTDPQEGDEFTLLLEKTEYGNGQPPTYRRVLAAAYNNAGTMHRAYLFEDENGRPRYYSHDGKSLQSSFLKSPMKFEARVSSRFSRRRFHPVLRIYRPHLGTDYAAPTGTPVQSVADGTVISSGYAGGGGNTVRIRHAGGYESAYLHLSRRFVRAGQRVSQGQRIGLVGATGIATGAHLDFRIRKSGSYLNFERLKPPRVTQIPAPQMAAFSTDRDRYAGLMAAARQSAKTVVASGETRPASASSTN